jgi:hypothetical protein
MKCLPGQAISSYVTDDFHGFDLISWQLSLWLIANKSILHIIFMLNFQDYNEFFRDLPVSITIEILLPLLKHDSLFINEGF